QEAVVAVAVAADVDAGELAVDPHVRRHDGDVHVGQAALDLLEHLDELGEVRRQRRLLLLHRIGVVDDEEDVDVAQGADRFVVAHLDVRRVVELRDVARRTRGDSQGTEREAGTSKHVTKAGNAHGPLFYPIRSPTRSAPFAIFPRMMDEKTYRMLVDDT